MLMLCCCWGRLIDLLLMMMQPAAGHWSGDPADHWYFWRLESCVGKKRVRKLVCSRDEDRVHPDLRCVIVERCHGE